MRLLLLRRQNVLRTLCRIQTRVPLGLVLNMLALFITHVGQGLPLGSTKSVALPSLVQSWLRVDPMSTGCLARSLAHEYPILHVDRHSLQLLLVRLLLLERQASRHVWHLTIGGLA